MDDVGARPEFDLGTVDQLARLALLARRHGVDLRVRASPELWELVELAGLSDVLACREDSDAVQRRRT